MNKSFFRKLAVSSLKKNRQTCLPYLITCIITAAVYYIMVSLSKNPGLKEMSGSTILTEILSLGCQVVLIFSVIFLFYSHRFLMKRRTKEFGLYNVLGMEKFHLARMLAWETGILYLVSMCGALLFGIALDKLMFLILASMIHAEIPLGFFLSGKAILSTLLLFFVIFLLTYLSSVHQIRTANPIELLRSDSAGEREPKSKWLLALLGILCVGSGYFLAITTKNPTASLIMFFFAVILVIIGTYLLFTAGSIVFLKLLRKNKRYYYQAAHFTSISGMLYRMKQNAVGLANICILSTMVLVMVSSTSSLIAGIRDVTAARYPKDFSVSFYSDETPDPEAFASQISALAKEKGIDTRDTNAYTYLNFTAVRDGNSFLPLNAEMEASLSTYDNLAIIMAIPLEDYNFSMGANETLSEDEVLLFTSRNTYESDTITLGDHTYRIREKPDSFPGNGIVASNIATAYYIVVPDDASLQELYTLQADVYQERASHISYYYGFDTDADKDSQIDFYNTVSERCSESGISVSVESKAEAENSILSLYGGLFFLGAFLGTLFLMAAILIIYYKQISEGFEDQERFAIMQKVGMSLPEIRRSIRSQVLMVFFLPLVTAGIHTAAAFPMVTKLLALFNLYNTKIFLFSTLICFFVFSLIYLLIYLLTSRTYYRIVSGKRHSVE